MGLEEVTSVTTNSLQKVAVPELEKPKVSDTTTLEPFKPEVTGQELGNVDDFQNAAQITLSQEEVEIYTKCKAELIQAHKNLQRHLELTGGICTDFAKEHARLEEKYLKKHPEFAKIKSKVDIIKENHDKYMETQRKYANLKYPTSTTGSAVDNKIQELKREEYLKMVELEYFNENPIYKTVVDADGEANRLVNEKKSKPWWLRLPSFIFR